MGDMSAISPRHDQLRDESSPRRDVVGNLLHRRSSAGRSDAGIAAPYVPAQRQRGLRLTAECLHDTLSVLARKYKVPGAQLAIHHNGVTTAVEVGELQYGTGLPVTREAAFPIGSVTKMSTAILAMILVGDGDLELDAPLGDHLPELSNDLGNQVTLRQVLSHTAGFAAGPDSDAVLDDSIRRYVMRFCGSQNSVLTPGTGFSYSNIGYILVGYIIEKITGMSWWDAMESILLFPMRIEPTFINSPRRRPPTRPLATGHSVNTAIGKIRPLKQSLSAAEAPAGGLALSAVDMAKLGLLQLGNNVPALLPSPYAEQMRQAVPVAEPFGLADQWGLGLAVFHCGNVMWLGHDGNADGTACYVRIEPVNGSVVALTSNANLGVGIWRELLTELRAVGLYICTHSRTENSRQPAMAPTACVGTYRNGDIEYRIFERKKQYYLAIDGETASKLEFYDDLTFWQLDVTSGERISAGRFLGSGTTGALHGIMVGGRVGRRQCASSETDAPSVPA